MRKKNDERRRIENRREKPNDRAGGIRTPNLPIMCPALYPLHHRGARDIISQSDNESISAERLSTHGVRPDETPSGLINNAKSHHQMSPLYRSCHAQHYNRRFPQPQPHGPPRTLRRPSHIFTVHLALFADNHPYPHYTSQTFADPWCIWRYM